jgi:hypothetical protein
LRGLLFETHFDLPGHRRNPDRDEAARALARASNTVMLDVVDTGLDLVESGAVTALDDPVLFDLARLARQEDRMIRRQMAEFDRTHSDEVYDALFR